MSDFRNLARWFRRMRFDEIDLELLDPNLFSDLSYDEDEVPTGWPWANRVCYFYDSTDSVLTGLLQKCGFTTGTYDEDYAVCGLDEGGYSFEDVHWIPLVLEYCKCCDINPATWLSRYYS